MPMNEAQSIPPNTGVPTFRRASREGPSAMTKGSSPRINAKDVIITGRKRSLAPSVAASSNGIALGSAFLGEFYDENAVLRSQPDQHDHADLRIEIERETRYDDSRVGTDNTDGD